VTCWLEGGERKQKYEEKKDKLKNESKKHSSIYPFFPQIILQFNILQFILFFLKNICIHTIRKKKLNQKYEKKRIN